MSREEVAPWTRTRELIKLLTDVAGKIPDFERNWNQEKKQLLVR